MMVEKTTWSQKMHERQQLYRNKPRFEQNTCQFFRSSNKKVLKYNRNRFIIPK